MRYSYVAEKQSGEIYKGTAEARDRFELYGVVRGEGGRIVSFEEDSSKSPWNFAYWNAKISTVKEYEKILMARNLGAMLAAGLALSRALTVLERQTAGPKLKHVISEIGNDVRRGETLHNALAKHETVFPRLFTAMVRAGEEGGDLPGTLALIADQMERMYVLKKKIKGAMIYPCIILVAIVGIGAFLMINVVPSLAKTFKQMNATLPLPTRVLIGISDFITHEIWLSIGAVIVLIILAIVALRAKPTRRMIDWLMLHLPSIGTIVKQLNAARTARTLSSLLAAGVDVVGSIDITAEVVQNPRFREVLIEAKETVQRGEPLSGVFMKHENLYPPFVGEMMAVGEETGQVAEMMKRLATYYEDEVDRATKDMSTIIEPFLMLVIGGAVGFFALAMISPIYGLANHIS